MNTPLTPADEQLLEQLFRPARECRLADDGFSQRVMQTLSSRRTADERITRLSRLWTVLCIVVAVALFFLLRGWIAVGQIVYTLLTTPPSHNTLLMVLLTVLVLTMVGAAEVLQRERYSTI